MYGVPYNFYIHFLLRKQTKNTNLKTKSRLFIADIFMMGVPHSMIVRFIGGKLFWEVLFIQVECIYIYMCVREGALYKGFTTYSRPSFCAHSVCAPTAE